MEYLVISAIVALLIIVISCLKVVPQGTEYVVEFLGKYRATWGAGLHFLIPFLLETSSLYTALLLYPTGAYP